MREAETRNHAHDKNDRDRSADHGIKKFQSDIGNGQDGEHRRSLAMNRLAGQSIRSWEDFADCRLLHYFSTFDFYHEIPITSMIACPYISGCDSRLCYTENPY
ncbi:hypothetical protein [Collimonas humicola]|uniref:hypothetical protein n=1 Tax=Collimonas humicola TaxID=2825886 RepID=UPI001E2D3AE8|nr:hypothetical protein [Collimonas humicola]